MCVSCTFCLSFFYSVFHLFLKREKEDMELGGWGGGVDLGEVEGRDTTVRVYFI